MIYDTIEKRSVEENAMKNAVQVTFSRKAWYSTTVDRRQLQVWYNALYSRPLDMSDDEWVIEAAASYAASELHPEPWECEQPKDCRDDDEPCTVVELPEDATMPCNRCGGRVVKVVKDEHYTEADRVFTSGYHVWNVVTICVACGARLLSNLDELNAAKEVSGGRSIDDDALNRDE